MIDHQNAILVLDDGTEFHGKSFGVDGATTGEVVFNTAMTGYQEIITDPSYDSQIITFTNPHIGNTGINMQDTESKKIYCSGRRFWWNNMHMACIRFSKIINRNTY